MPPAMPLFQRKNLPGPASYPLLSSWPLPLSVQGLCRESKGSLQDRKLHMWRNEKGSGWCVLRASWNPRQLWKVVQARNNKAHSQDRDRRLSLDPAVRATPLSSRSEGMSVLLLSAPDLQQKPTEYKVEVQTTRVLLSAKRFDSFCLSFS